MAWKREPRKRVVELIERVEPKVAVIAIATLILGGFLARRGSEQSEAIRSAGEVFDWICLLCSLALTVIACLSWYLRRAARVPEHFNPAFSLLERVRPEAACVRVEADGTSSGAAFRFVIPTAEDLDVFAKWSEEDEAIGAANDLAGHQRKLLYERWYGANPKHFLILQKQCGTIDWTTVGISILMPLPRKTALALRSKRMTVIDITTDDLHFETGERKNTCLLYDTLIFSEEFRGKFAELKRWHSIFHASCFASPTEAEPVTMWIEPDNKKLAKSFSRKRYGDHTTFALANGHSMYELQLPNGGSVRARQFVMLWSLLRVKSLMPRMQGLAGHGAGRRAD